MKFIDLQDFGTTTESHHQSTASLSQAAQIFYIVWQRYQTHRISLCPLTTMKSAFVKSNCVTWAVLVLTAARNFWNWQPSSWTRKAWCYAKTPWREILICLRYMKIHIFALRWRDEIKGSSQLRTLLKLVVVNFHISKMNMNIPENFLYIFLNIFFRSYLQLLVSVVFSLSCEDPLISSLFVIDQSHKQFTRAFIQRTVWCLPIK